MATHPKVTVYLTRTDTYSQMEQDWLTQHAIPYTACHVDEESDKAEEMIARSGQMGVPVTIIERDDTEKIIIGFDEPALAKALIDSKE